MAFQTKDYYFKKAKTENYAARSVFKLQEIDERFHIIKPGYQILDLGAAPGSWSQYASSKIGPLGRILGIDLQKIHLTLSQATFVQADLNTIDLTQDDLKNVLSLPCDVVLSDMAPKTTGIRITDQTRSIELCQLALVFAKRYLKPRGSFICKLFHSEEFGEFRDQLRKCFGRVEVLRPKSTRKESKEIFFIAMQFKRHTDGIKT